MSDNDQDILERYKKAKAEKGQPIYMFKDLDNVDAWSNIPPEMLGILIELEMLANECDCQFIHERIVMPTFRIYLSVKGYARGQVEHAHTGIYEELKNILAGMDEVQNDKARQFQDRK